MGAFARAVFVSSALSCASCTFPDFQADPAIDDASGTDSTVDAATDASTDASSDAKGDAAEGASDSATETDLEGGACGAAPTLHPGSTGVYCPFTSDGGATTCPSGQICCESTGTAPSICVPSAMACSSSSTVWQCDAPSSCAAGLRCCGNGTPTVRPGCSYYWIRPPQGTVCTTTCAGSQFDVCEADSDCPGGRRCTPLKSGGKDIGFCN